MHVIICFCCSVFLNSSPLRIVQFVGFFRYILLLVLYYYDPLLIYASYGCMLLAGGQSVLVRHVLFCFMLAVACLILRHLFPFSVSLFQVFQLKCVGCGIRIDLRC